jgi:Aerobic-type carbon monoxide dehydrogenase, large subunit CoxL/CutL homologs
VQRDTDVTPYDMGTLGSRSLFHMGHAVRLASEEARDKIKALARDVGEPEGSNIPLAELFKKKYGMQAGNIVGTGIYKPDYVPPDPATGLTPNATPSGCAPPLAPRSRSTPRPAKSRSRASSTWSTAAAR